MEKQPQKISGIIEPAKAEWLRELSPEQSKANLELASKKIDMPRQATGILSQYKPQLIRCRFKLVVYWDVDKHGNYYTVAQKKAGKNRKPIPSIDFDIYNRLNHQDAYNALCDKVYEQAERMDKAILIYNDYINNKEHWIAVFNPKNLLRSIKREVHFKDADANGNILFDYYEGTPIRLDDMRFYEK